MKECDTRPPMRRDHALAPGRTTRHSSSVSRGRDWKRLARYVRSRRMELGYHTTRELARAVGISWRTIGNLERGQSVSANTLTAVENILDWMPGGSELVLDGGEPIPKSPEGPTPRAVAAAAAELEQIYSTPQPPLRERIIRAPLDRIVETQEWITELLGPAAGEKWLRAALKIREDAASEHRRDAG